MKRIFVTNDADQQFAIVLDGSRITMRIRHNVRLNRWAFDLARDDQWVLRARRIVPGIDLLEGSGITGLGSIFAHTAKEGSKPDRTGLPNGAVRLYYVA